jgi:Gnt-I system low-affinity gluconate transporter
MANSALPPIALAYILALLIRVSQGSVTVAMITSAGIISPLLTSLALSEPHKALTVITIASGATTASYVNDSGFWLAGKTSACPKNKPFNPGLSWKPSFR